MLKIQKPQLKSEALTLKVEVGTFKSLHKLAKKKRMTMSEIIRQFIKQGLSNV